MNYFNRTTKKDPMAALAQDMIDMIDACTDAELTCFLRDSCKSPSDKAIQEVAAYASVVLGQINLAKIRNATSILRDKVKLASGAKK